MEKQQRRPFGEGFFFGLCAFPLFWLSQLYALEGSAAIVLGHWPGPNDPGPQSLGLLIALERWGVLVSACWWPFWLILCPCWTLIFLLHRRFRVRWHGWALLMLVGGSALVWREMTAAAGLMGWFR